MFNPSIWTSGWIGTFLCLICLAHCQAPSWAGTWAGEEMVGEGGVGRGREGSIRYSSYASKERTFQLGGIHYKIRRRCTETWKQKHTFHSEFRNAELTKI